MCMHSSFQIWAHLRSWVLWLDLVTHVQRDCGLWGHLLSGWWSSIMFDIPQHCSAKSVRTKCWYSPTVVQALSTGPQPPAVLNIELTSLLIKECSNHHSLLVVGIKVLRVLQSMAVIFKVLRRVLASFIWLQDMTPQWSHSSALPRTL